MNGDKGKAVAVDLDGVIYEVYWDTEDVEIKYRPFVFGSKIKGAKQALADLQDKGYRIIIHTCRVIPELNEGYSEKQLYDIVRNKLDVDGVPYDEIWTERGKPLAAFYVDDRAVRFEDWDRVMRELEDEL